MTSARTEPMLIVALAAGAGAISPAIEVGPPHGPIAVLMGAHLPLLFAAWKFAGQRRGALGVSGGLSLRLVWAIFIYINLAIGLILTLGVVHAISATSVFVGLAGTGLLLSVWIAFRDNDRIDLPVVRRRVAWLWLPVCMAAAMVSTHALLYPEYDFDVLTYHLFFPARWAQEHRVSIVPTWFSDPAQAYAPAATEIYYLSLMLPLRSDHLARCGQLLFWIELLAVVAALGRELGMRTSARVLATGCVLMTPAIAWQAGTAMVDVALAAHLAAVALFSIRVARRPGAVDAAGLILAVGLAAGTKFLALPYLLALAPLWGRALVSIARRQRTSARRWPYAGAVLAALIIAAWNGGYWYARNWLAAGNPLYPVNVRLGGVSLFDGAFDRAAMLNSPFNQSRHGWSGLQEVLGSQLSLPAWSAAAGAWDAARASRVGAGSMLILTLVATGVSLTRFRLRGRSGLVSLQMSIILMIVLFWWVIPYQESRFAWPMLALAIVALFAFFTGMSGRAGGVLAGLVGAGWAALTAGPCISTFVAHAGIGAAVAAGLLFVLNLKARRLAFPATLILCSAGVWMALWSIDRNGDPPRRATQGHSRWRGFGDAWGWVDAHVDGKTIAYAGNNVPYFLTGPTQRNRAIVVPAAGGPGWRHHDFAQAPAARELGRPNVTDFAVSRLRMDGQAWLRGLKCEQVDYVAVTRLFRGVTLSHRHDGGGFPIERQWLDALANTRDAAGRPLASRDNFGGGWLLFYRLNLPDDESQWPRLSTFVQRETDALDRRRRDGTPPGAPIDGYPLAAQAIEETKLDALP